MTRFVLYTNVISPHQLPLAREIAKLVGDGNFRYVYTTDNDQDHQGLDWRSDTPKWCIKASEAETAEWLENADTLLSGLRCFDLFERRAKSGFKNFYMTERWFKPPIGILRLLHPRYLGYARRLCQMLEAGAVVGLPIGIHAARDMARLCGLMHGDIRCIFSAPDLEFEKQPGGKIFGRGERVESSGANSRVERVECGDKYCLDKMRMWGYFVAEGTGNREQGTGDVVREVSSSAVRVLWVGRLLDWKRVDTIIKAVGELAKRQNITLDIYGTGPEEERLKRLATKYREAIKFYPPVPIAEVRKLMREHDVYVLASNGYEGWGAVVSEALEEGMRVIGTHEAGSSATILPENCLYRAGDWRALARLWANDTAHIGIGEWTATEAAKAIVSI